MKKVLNPFFALFKRNSLIVLTIPIYLLAILYFHLFSLKRILEQGLFDAGVEKGTDLLNIYLYEMLLLLITLSLASIAILAIFLANEKRKEEMNLKEKLRDKEIVLSIASHELYTPLSQIRGTLSVVGPELTGSYQRFVESAISSSDELIKLIDDLLAVSRFEMNKMKLSKEPVFLTTLCQEVAAGFSENALRAGVTLKVDQTENDLPQIALDREKIREVLINFVANALKYTPTGSVTLRPFLKDKTAVVAVSDTGPGIKPEQIKNLFNLFVRLEPNPAKHHGSGLGLYISRLIIEAHQGKIWAESKVGQGSTFFFSLPLKAV